MESLKRPWNETYRTKNEVMESLKRPWNEAYRTKNEAGKY